MELNVIISEQTFFFLVHRMRSEEGKKMVLLKFQINVSFIPEFICCVNR